MFEIGMVILGVILHWVKKLSEITQHTGKVANPLDFFLSRPYKIVGASVMAVAGGSALWHMGMLDPASALLLGFTCDSIAGTLQRRT